MDEAEKKNSTLGATLEKVRNRLINTFTDSAVEDALSVVLEGVGKLIQVLIALPGFIKENRVEIGLMAAAYVAFNFQSAAATANMLREKLAVEVLRKAHIRARLARRALNAAYAANPIGVTIAAVLLLVTAFVTLYRNSETVRNGINRFADALREAIDQVPFFVKVLFPAVGALQLMLDIFREGPGVIKSYLDSFVTFAKNVPLYFDIVELKARQFGLAVKDALNFGFNQEEIDRQLQEVADQIAGKREEIAENNAGYREREIERSRTAAQKEGEAAMQEYTKQQDELVRQKVRTNQELTELDRKLFSRFDNEEKKALLQERARAEEQQRLDEEKKERLLSERERDLQRVKNKVIAGKELTEVEQAIYDALTDQEKKALKKRADLREQAAEDERRRQEQAERDRAAAIARIEDLENEAIGNRFDQQAAQARTSAARDIAALVGDPEQIERQAELIRDRLRKELEGIEDDRSEAFRAALETVRGYEQELQDLQTGTGTQQADAALKQLRTALEAESKALERQQRQRRLATLESFRAGEIDLQEYYRRQDRIRTDGEAALLAISRRRATEEVEAIATSTAAKLEQMDAEYDALQKKRDDQEQKRKEEIDRLREQGDLTREEADAALKASEDLRREQDITDLQNHENKKLEIVAESTDQQLEIQENAVKREGELTQQQIDDLERLRQIRADIYAELLTDLSTLTGQFLADSNRSFNEYFKELLITTLRAVKRVLLVTYAQITAEDVLSKGFAGIATAALKIAAIEAVFGVAETAVRSFQEGGAIGGRSDGLGNVWEGGQVPMHAGFTRGRSHAAGGIRQGGVELEGDEYVLRNGPERLVVNGRSARAFEPVLRELSKNPDIFSPFRRQKVSAINAVNGWGRKFASGGVIGPTPVPLNAPLNENGLVPFLASPTGADTALRELSERALYAAERATAAAEAANARIDRLRVYNDPAEVVRYGQDKIKSESRGEL